MTTCFLSDGFNIVKVSLILANREKNTERLLFLISYFFLFLNYVLLKS